MKTHPSEVEDMLRSYAEYKESGLYDEDYCMCGSHMSDHSIGSGHGPLSVATYVRSGLIETCHKQTGIPYSELRQLLQ